MATRKGGLFYAFCAQKPHLSNVFNPGTLKSMNEIVFIAHSLIIGAFTLTALRMGKYALVAMVALQAVLANLFVLKQHELFGLNATCADAYTIGAVVGLNLLQEYYGKRITQTAIWLSFGALVFYTVMSQFHLMYQPSSADFAHGHYAALLGLMPRIIIASFTSYFIVQQLDYYIFGALKQFFNGKYLVWRYYASICFCQLIDTILFSFLGLYGILDNIGEIIIFSYLIKLAAILIATPVMLLSKKMVRHD